MKVIFHEEFYQVYISDPAAAAGRMEAVMQVIEDQVELVVAEPATEQDIGAVHTKAHIESVRRNGLYEISALAAGGAIQAAEIGLSEPCFALIRPPGHHASVLDFDLHFGDGNVNILGGRPDVTVYNVETSDRDRYMSEIAYEMEKCRADIIGISAGFDNHRDDWGGLLFTEDYEEIGRMVRDASRRIGGGCFAILEGGYNHDVLGQNVLALIQGLSGD